MVKSSHSWRFVLRGFGAGVCPPSCAPSPVWGAGGSVIWLACTPLSLCRLATLLPSSSVRVVSAILGGVAVESPLRALFDALFICWISNVIFSVFIASRMLVVAVGKRARTVKVQSSWFCSNRRRRLYATSFGQFRGACGETRLAGCRNGQPKEDVLLFGDTVATHALARIVDFVQYILCG